MITKNNNILGGEPIISETRITVRCIVEAVKRNESIHTIISAYPQITVRNICESLMYYVQHQHEIDIAIMSNR